MGMFEKWNITKQIESFCKYEFIFNKESGFVVITDLATVENNAMSVTNGLEGVLLEISAELLVTKYYMDPSKVVILNTNKTWDAVVWDSMKEKWIWVATEMPKKEIAELLAIRHISEKQCDFALAMVKKKEDEESSETIEEKMNRILQVMRTNR